MSVKQLEKYIQSINPEAYKMPELIKQLEFVLDAIKNKKSITIKSSYHLGGGKRAKRTVTGKVVRYVASTVTVFASTKEFPEGREWVAWLSDIKM